MRRWTYLMLLVAATAQAAEKGKPVGTETRDWLELQKTGSQATSAPSIVPGEVADRVYRRYLDSFSHPIPAQFESSPRKDGD